MQMMSIRMSGFIRPHIIFQGSEPITLELLKHIG